MGDSKKYDEMIESGSFSRTKEDPIVANVKFLYDLRSRKGQQQYGTTLYESNEDFLAWVNHLQEEMMDATLYLERLKMEYEK